MYIFEFDYIKQPVHNSLNSVTKKTRKALSKDIEAIKQDRIFKGPAKNLL